MAAVHKIVQVAGVIVYLHWRRVEFQLPTGLVHPVQLELAIFSGVQMDNIF